MNDILLIGKRILSDQSPVVLSSLPGMMLAENAELVAVMDANREAADRCKEKYNAKYAFDKAEDLLALEEIEAVYIASPVFCHKEQVEQAAKAKKHILLEKPMGLSVEESKEIGAICSQKAIEDVYKLNGMSL